MRQWLLNSISHEALLQSMKPRMYPKECVFIRKLPKETEILFNFPRTIYQAIDEFGEVVQSYGGEPDLVFKTARRDGFDPQWAQ